MNGFPAYTGFDAATLASAVSVPSEPTEPWLQVLGGKAFSLTNPRAEDVDFETIATVLSRVPRFGGHTESGVLSVAQHSLEGAAAIRRDGHGDLAAAAFLIHDAHEAYMGDIATPVAKALGAIASEEAETQTAAVFVNWTISELKRRLDVAIHEAAGIPFPLDPATSQLVKEYDVRMMCTEAVERLAVPEIPWLTAAPRVTGCDLWHWSAGTTAKCFSRACRELLPSLKASEEKR